MDEETMPALNWLIRHKQGSPEFLGNLAEELEVDLTQYKLVLALAMYRESLNDTAAHSDEWPPGVVSNLGELDYAAETLIRSTWEELPMDERYILLITAATAVREFLVMKEESRGP